MKFYLRSFLLGLVSFIAVFAALADDPEREPDPRTVRPTTFIAVSDPAFPSFLSRKAELANYEALESIKAWVKNNKQEYFRLITAPEKYNSITFTNADPLRMPDNKRFKFTVAYQKLYASIQIQRYQLGFEKEDKEIHQEKVKIGYVYLVTEKDLAILKKLLKGYAK